MNDTDSRGCSRRKLLSIGTGLLGGMAGCAELTTGDAPSTEPDGQQEGTTVLSTTEQPVESTTTAPETTRPSTTTEQGTTTSSETTTTRAARKDLTIIADEGADAFEYVLHIRGTAELVTSGENAATPVEEGGSGTGEEVVENGDGTVTISGIVANGGGDSFRFTGEIVESAFEGPVTVRIDGEEVYSTSTHRLRIVAAEGADAFDYEILIEGSAELVTSGQYSATPKNAGREGVGEEVVRENDGVVTVLGVVAGGGGDTFTFTGDIRETTLHGPGTVYVDGEVVYTTT